MPFFSISTNYYAHVLKITVCISIIAHILALCFLSLPMPDGAKVANTDYSSVTLDLNLLQTVQKRAGDNANMAEKATMETDAVPARNQEPEKKEVESAQATGEQKEAAVKKPETVKREAIRPRAKREQTSARSKNAVKQANAGKGQGSAAKPSQTTNEGANKAPEPLAGVGNPKPKYPELARKRGQEGTVLIYCEIDAQGRISRIRIDKSSGFRLLDEAALNTVRKWRFRPAMRSGAAAHGVVIVPVKFKLE